MEKYLDPQTWDSLLPVAEAWLRANLLVPGNLVQAAGLVAAFLIARLVAPRLRRWAAGQEDAALFGHPLKPAVEVALTLAFPVAWWLLLWVASQVAERAGWPHHLLRIVVSLLTAWIIIRLSASLVRDHNWAKLIAGTAWVIAALNIVNLLDPTIALLDSLAIRVGELRVSVLSTVKGMLALAVLMWIALVVSRLFERRIRDFSTLTPSVQVLLSKVLRVTLLAVAAVTALTSVGIDLSAFALFTGAVGVGVGFGLQKVVSNLVSGVILLLDKSVKPGDVISVGETYGSISSLGARYVSVVTLEGKEHLIPNEELITNQVINWSYSNNEVLVRIPIGISYNSDVPLAISLCVQAATGVPRLLPHKNLGCYVEGFGDSSVDLVLIVWINDPQNGTLNLRSEILLRVWELFHQHGIEIPYPQRDLHLRSPKVLKVALQTDEENGV